MTHEIYIFRRLRSLFRIITQRTEKFASSSLLFSFGQKEFTRDFFLKEFNSRKSIFQLLERQKECSELNECQDEKGERAENYGPVRRC